MGRQGQVHTFNMLIDAGLLFNVSVCLRTLDLGGRTRFSILILLINWLQDVSSKNVLTTVVWSALVQLRPSVQFRFNDNN